MARIVGTDIFGNTEMDIFGDGTMTTSYIGEPNENVVKIEDDAKIQIGDFKINAKDLGRLLKKFAEENMPEVLV